MGCTSSIHRKFSMGVRKKKGIIHEIAVFVPTLRIPLAVDIIHPLRRLVSQDVLDKLSTLRSRLVSLAEESYVSVVPTSSEVLSALEEYLPVLLGLTKQEKLIEGLVKFKWKSIGDDGQEISLASPQYELLSVIHMIAMLLLLEANLVLVPRDSPDSCETEVLEESKKMAFDLLLKASGCLEYCVRHILVHLPIQIRKSLPIHLEESLLEAISLQALAQGVEMQLGLAVESDNATLSVKRRLACEELGYISKAHYCLSGYDINNTRVKKLLLFIRWKYLEAKATAYYYHGHILDKGNEPSDHMNAVCCFFAADELLTDSKRACLSFCLAAPITRVPAPWGVMKNMHKKIPEAATKKSKMYSHLFEQEKNGAFQNLPELPEFQLSLKPEDFELPETDAAWSNENCQPQIQSLKAHLKDDEDEASSD